MLAVLDTLLDTLTRVGVVSGPAGMGKTALAVQWAHRVADRYPDGQLYLDLRGHDPATAMPAAEAVTHLLAGLGVSPDAMPAGATEHLGLYRSLLHQRRVLLLLDNAGVADQVAALAPTAITSLMLVTSRNKLTGLAVEHAVTSVDLDVLPSTDALALLRQVLGAGRIAAELGQATSLIDLCGRMPLALRIAAAKLASRPQRPIAHLVADLAGADRLGGLGVPGDSRSIRTVFASAYRALSQPAARMFRRLGRHPGPTFTAGLAAAVADVSPSRAQHTLDELATVHLITETETETGRYRIYDLVRLYAAECLQPDEVAYVTGRILDWYLIVADAANRIFEPTRDRARLNPADPPIPVPFAATHDEARDFLDTERANLRPVARHAIEVGHDDATWRLAYLLTSFYTLRGYLADRLEVCRAGWPPPTAWLIPPPRHSCAAALVSPASPPATTRRHWRTWATRSP